MESTLFETTLCGANNFPPTTTISISYTTDRKYQTSGFEYFVKSGFEREPLMLDKQMIPHFKGLDVGSKISQELPCSSVRDNHATFLVKNTLFKEEVV